MIVFETGFAVLVTSFLVVAALAIWFAFIYYMEEELKFRFMQILVTDRKSNLN